MTAEAPAAGQPAIGDVGRAFVAASRRAELLALVMAVIVGPLISVLLNIGIALSPLGRIWLEVPFPWLSLADLFFVLLLAVVWTASAIWLLPRGMKPAFETFTWAGERALNALRAVTGSDRPPTSPADARAWLGRNPESDANRWARAEVLLLARELDEARETIGRLPDGTAEERVVKADLEATAEMIATGRADLAPMRRAAAEATGDARLDAIANLAIMESRMAVASGGDWQAPLATARAQLGSHADGILWRGYAWRRLRLLMPLMLLVALAFGVIELVSDGVGPSAGALR